MDIQAPQGVFDILPRATSEMWRSSHIWQAIEDIIREVAREYGLCEIRTPMFERVELFQRGVGDETDIVSKEMYVFEDRGGRKLALRPEGTASVIRALIEHQAFSPTLLQRYYYFGPMFRYERPQAGRFRQHHQFGVEIFGIPAPECDAEGIAILVAFLKKLGLSHLTVSINSLGDKGCRERFKEALLSFLEHHIESMSEDSKRRFHKNPLRILDSKDPKDQEIVEKAPSILDFLSPEDKAHFQRVQELLTKKGIKFEVVPRLVRGLDYYQRTVFEVVSGKLGAQNSVGGGGRYDGLVKELGGPDLACFGFGAGIERVIQVLLKDGKQDFAKIPTIPLVIIPMGEKAKEEAFLLSEKLREMSLELIVDYTGKKMKQSMSVASEIGASFVLVLGDEELDQQKAKLKYLQDGSLTEVSLKNPEEIVQCIKKVYE